MLEQMVFAVELLGRVALRMFVVVLEVRLTSTPVCRSRKALTAIPARIRVRSVEKELLDMLEIVTGPVRAPHVLRTAVSVPVVLQSESRAAVRVAIWFLGLVLSVCRSVSGHGRWTTVVYASSF